MSNDNVQEQMREKIKKLMRLGLDDPDSHESQRALEKAADLMAMYDIQNIDMNEDGSVKPAALVETFVEVYDKHSDAWEGPLGFNIAECLDCQMLTIRRRDRLPRRSFMGASDDVDMAVFFFKYIRMQIQRMAESKYKLIRDRKTYGYGCVITVIERLQSMYEYRKKSAAIAGTTALMVVKSDSVDQYVKSKYKVRKRRKIQLTGSMDSLNKGIDDGNKVQINKQVGGNVSGAHPKLT